MDKNPLNFLSITRVNNSSFIDNKGIAYYGPIFNMVKLSFKYV